METLRWLGAFCVLFLIGAAGVAIGEEKADGGILQPEDVFHLEFASDTQISPDGSTIVYVRNFMDIMKDRRRSNLWIIRRDGTRHRPLTNGIGNDQSPRWSPGGDRLLYVSRGDGHAQLYVRWMDTGEVARLTQLTEPPGGISWSPDGRWIAMTMRVPGETSGFVKPPSKPNGAEWADPPRVITKLQYRADGAGYLPDGYRQLFVLPAEGGTPRQLTTGPYNHGGVPQWTPDSRFLVFSANRHPDGEYDPVNSEIYKIAVAGGEVTALSDRKGPDGSPAISPDGRQIAYIGFDDREQGYHLRNLYVMNSDGSSPRQLLADLDRDIQNPRWSADGKHIYFQYDDKGNTKIARTTLAGRMNQVTANVGGLSLGRPYAGGMYTLARTGHIAFTLSRPDHPADVAVVGGERGEPRRLTTLNEDLFANKTLARVEEIWYPSSFDQRQVQAWVAYPPGFDASGSYPLLLEIHGGPFTNYGDRFAAEIQLFAAAGYVVLYVNPRGSTSYGQTFGNLIHHNYPGEDYDDLMSGVDAVVARGFIDESRLYITGGSGGGVLTSWSIGKTNRFRAAVVAKPVINWYSFALTADMYNFFYKYWFPGFPWDHPEEYHRRSPISLVGNVSTPTMVLTGEADYRTPMSESEQYYQALKLRRVDAALVRIPGASHGIAARPSQLIAKVTHILKWFEMHQPAESATGSDE